MTRAASKWVTLGIGALALVAIGVWNSIWVDHRTRGRDRSARPAVRWERFASAEGRFAVEMPESSVQSTMRKNDWGIEYDVVARGSSDGVMGFTVGYYDRPDSPFVLWFPEALFAGLRLKAQDMFPDAKVAERPFQLGQLAGVKITLDAPNGKRQWFVGLLSGERFYVLGVNGTTATWNDAQAQRFLNSFQRLPVATTSKP